MEEKTLENNLYPVGRGRMKEFSWGIRLLSVVKGDLEKDGEHRNVQGGLHLSSREWKP